MGVHEISVVCRGGQKGPKNPCYVALVPVNSTHADHDDALPGWIRARDLLAGEDAVKAAGAKYLPRLEGQSNEDYSAYRAEDILNWRVGRVNGRNVPTLIVLRETANDLPQPQPPGSRAPPKPRSSESSGATENRRGGGCWLQGAG